MKNSGAFYLNKIFHLARIKTCLIAFIIVASISFYQYHHPVHAIILGLTIMASACFGFSINEYYDHKKDVLMAHDHLIPSGMIGRTQVRIIAFFFLMLSILLTGFLSPFQQLLNIILIFILSIYSFVNNRYGVIANMLVAISCCLGILITLNTLEWSITCYSGLTFFLHILGREIILDIHDYAADRAIGKNSFPILFTIQKSFAIAILLSIICIIYATIIGIYFTRYNYIFFIFLANMVFLAGLINYRINTKESEYDKFVLISRLSFIFIIPALLL